MRRILAALFVAAGVLVGVGTTGVAAAPQAHAYGGLPYECWHRVEIARWTGIFDPCVSDWPINGTFYYQGPRGGVWVQFPPDSSFRLQVWGDRIVFTRW